MALFIYINKYIKWRAHAFKKKKLNFISFSIVNYHDFHIRMINILHILLIYNYYRYNPFIYIVLSRRRRRTKYLK